MSREFKIETSPHGEHKVYKRAKITIEEGVTVLVGCNGSGKTTLLHLIKSQLQKRNIPVLAFDNLHDGGSSARSEASFIGDYSFLATSMSSSEGENIVLNLVSLARRIGRFISSKGQDDGKPLNGLSKAFMALANKDNLEENKVPQTGSEEYWILLDAIDSGLSVDNVQDIKDYLFKPILEDVANKGVKLYIVVSANEYEMCINEKCFHVQKGSYVSVSSYEEFRSIVLDTRKYKDSQIEKYERKG